MDNRRATAAAATRRFHDSDSDDSVTNESTAPFYDQEDWSGFLTPTFECDDDDDDEPEIIPPSPRPPRPFRKKRGRYMIQRKPKQLTNTSKKLRLDGKRSPGCRDRESTLAGASDGEIVVDRAKKCENENIAAKKPDVATVLVNRSDGNADDNDVTSSKGAVGGLAYSPPRIKLPLWPLPSASGSSKIAVVNPSPFKRPESAANVSLDQLVTKRHSNSTSLLNPQPGSSKSPDFFDIGKISDKGNYRPTGDMSWMSAKQRCAKSRCDGRRRLSSSDEDEDVTPWSGGTNVEPSRSNWFRPNSEHHRKPVDSQRVSASGSKSNQPSQRRYPLFRSGSTNDNGHFHDTRRKIKPSADGWVAAVPYEDRRRSRWLEQYGDISPPPPNHILHCSFTLSPSTSSLRSSRRNASHNVNAKQKQMFGQALDPTVFDADLSSESDDDLPSTSRKTSGRLLPGGPSEPKGNSTLSYAAADEDSDSDYEVVSRTKPRCVIVDDTSSSDESPPQNQSFGPVRHPYKTKNAASRNAQGLDDQTLLRSETRPLLDFGDGIANFATISSRPIEVASRNYSQRTSHLPSRRSNGPNTTSASSCVLAVDSTPRRFDGSDGPSGRSRTNRDDEPMDTDDSFGVFDAIQRIEQIEADEAFARQLQAQFDAELRSSNAAEQASTSAPDVTFLQNRAGPSSHGRLHRSHTPSTRAATSTSPGSYRTTRIRRQPTVRLPTQQSLLSGTRHRMTSGRTRASNHDNDNPPVVMGTTHNLVHDDQLNRRVLDLHNELIGLFSSMTESEYPDGADENNTGIGNRRRNRTRRWNLRPRTAAENLLDLNFSTDDELTNIDFTGDGIAVFSGEDEDSTPALVRRRRNGTGSGPAARRRSRSRGQRRLRDDYNVLNFSLDSDYDLLIELTERIGNVPRGLSRTRINRLPVSEFSGANEDLPNGQTECHICMCDYEIGERLRILPCFHSFHAQCIDRWLREKNNCPICRMDIN